MTADQWKQQAAEHADTQPGAPRDGERPTAFRRRPQHEPIDAGIEISEIDMAAFTRAAQPLLKRYLQSDALRSLYDDIKALA